MKSPEPRACFSAQLWEKGLDFFLKRRKAFPSLKEYLGNLPLVVNSRGHGIPIYKWPSFLSLQNDRRGTLILSGRTVSLGARGALKLEWSFSRVPGPPEKEEHWGGGVYSASLSLHPSCCFEARNPRVGLQSLPPVGEAPIHFLGAKDTSCSHCSSL